jgi:hypothetical protein
MWNQGSDVTYRDARLHFNRSSVVPDGSGEDAEIRNTLRTVSSLRNAWYDDAVKSAAPRR